MVPSRLILVKISVFWHMTPYSLFKIDLRFGEHVIVIFTVQGRNRHEAGSMEETCSSETQLIMNGQLDVIFRKTELFITIDVRTSDPASNQSFDNNSTE
jgi:hypothetical protein